jgi:hypothetical protein
VPTQKTTEVKTPTCNGSHARERGAVGVMMTTLGVWLLVLAVKMTTTIHPPSIITTATIIIILLIIIIIIYLTASVS